MLRVNCVFRDTGHARRAHRGHVARLARAKLPALATLELGFEASTRFERVELCSSDQLEEDDTNDSYTM